MKSRKRRKTLVIRGWNRENAEKRPSSVDETKKMVKISFPPRLKLKKRQNRLSATADEWKTAKTAFRPWPKVKKRRKPTFGRGRRVKNSKNSVSATAEKRKTAKTAFRPRPKLKNTLKTALTPYGKCKNSLKTAFQPLGNPKIPGSRLSNPLEVEKTPESGSPTPWKQKDGCLNRIHVKYVSFEVFRQSVDYHNGYLIWCFLQHLVTLKILAICAISACNLRQNAWWFQSLCEVKW